MLLIGSVARARPAGLVVAAAAVLALAGCSSLSSALDGGTPQPRDAQGRPLADPPAPPTTCVTPSTSTTGPCVPVHNPPSRRFVEQAVPTLLPTRGYGSIGPVRCTERREDRFSDPTPEGLDRISHWTCVGQEPEGDWLHQDVVWTPSYGYLVLAAVSRDRSSALTVPDPSDPGLPNPHAGETATPPAG